MTNRLKGYCRRVVLEAAREGSPSGKRRTKDSTEAAFLDAMHGTDTGWWNDPIYTAPMLDMANCYRKDIAAVVRDYCEETGIPVHDTYGTEHSFADVIVAATDRYTWDDYQGHNGRDAETNAMALLWGLCFAVEYLIGELTREYCPDL